MKKSFKIIFLVFLLTAISGCSSKDPLVFKQNKSNNIYISKQICTDANIFYSYSSLEIEDILLQKAKEEILFDFLNENTLFTQKYTNLDILNKIKVKRQILDMTSDFNYYCLKVDAVVEDSDIIHDEMVLENYIDNYSMKSL